MESNELQNRERASGLIAIATNKDKLREYERTLTIEKIVTDALPIHQLQKEVGTRQVAIALDLQLTRLVANLNLKWTLNDNQIKLIVDDLIEVYRNETLEDFILCFKKARQGAYGELIRLDAPIVFSWMKLYLDEKYQVIEARTVQLQDAHKKENEVNYEEYRKRMELQKKEVKRPNAPNENEIQRQKLAHPRAYYTVSGLNIQVLAESQADAEEIVKGMLERGELEEDFTDDQQGKGD